MSFGTFDDIARDYLKICLMDLIRADEKERRRRGRTDAADLALLHTGRQFRQSAVPPEIRPVPFDGYSKGDLCLNPCAGSVWRLNLMLLGLAVVVRYLNACPQLLPRSAVCRPDEPLLSFRPIAPDQLTRGFLPPAFLTLARVSTGFRSENVRNGRSGQ